MVSDVGKTIASMKLIDGSVVNFFNGVYSVTNNVYYYTPYGDIRYSIGYDSGSYSAKYRCCHFVVSNPQSQMSGEGPKVLPCLKGIELNNTQASGGVSAYPLWQFISPTINKLSADEYQISWWSNVTASPGDVYYKYNPNNILKFRQDDLENANQYQNQATGKILCTASIHWQNLIYSTTAGDTSATAVMTPVIYNPIIVAYITNQGLITDFSTGGGGGGNSIHGHTSNEDCGFAAAVFMPSANMRVLNWR